MNRFFPLIFSLLLSNCSNPQLGDLVITNVNIIDVTSGEVLPAQDLLIIDNKIASIENYRPTNKYQTEVNIDGSGKYIIPGLWDAHTHILWRTDEFDLHNKLMIANGVTAFRDMWGSDEIAKTVRERMESREFINQRFIQTNHMLDGPPELNKGSGEVRNIEEAIHFVDSIVENSNPDFIKVYSQLSKEVFFAIADKAKQYRMDFVGHIPSEVPLEDAISAGLRSTEHLLGFFIALSDKRDFFYNHPEIEYPKRMDLIVKNQSNSRIDTVANTLKKYNSFVVPTLIISKASYLSYSYDSVPNTYLNSFIPEYQKDYWIVDYPGYEEYYNEEIFNRTDEIVKLLSDRGVKIVAGTDASAHNAFTYPGFSLHDELELLAEAGLEETEVLKSATIYPAELAHMQDSIGKVEVGFLADLVLLEENPLENIKNIKSIRGVISNGNYYNEEELNGLLEKAQIEAAKLKPDSN